MGHANFSSIFSASLAAGTNNMGQTQSNIDLAPLINILKDINVQSRDKLDSYAQQLHDHVSIDIIPNLLNDLLLIMLIIGFIGLLVFGIALKSQLKRMDETLSEEDRLMRNTIRDRQYSKAMSADVNELIEIISKKLNFDLNCINRSHSKNSIAFLSVIFFLIFL